IKNRITSNINLIKSTVSRVFNTIKSTITGVWNGIKSSTSRIWNSMVNIVKSPIRLIISAINSMINGINSIRIKSPKIPSWVPKFGGKGFDIGFNIPNIPSLDVGTNYVAGDGLAMLHKGEAVVPKKYNPAYGDNNISSDLLIEQNKLLKKLVDKDTSININKKDMTDVVNGENALNGLTNYF